MTGSIWLDVLLFVVFITVLSVVTFRLDTILTSSRPKPSKPVKKFCGVDGTGFTDPDGRDPRRKRRS